METLKDIIICLQWIVTDVQGVTCILWFPTTQKNIKSQVNPGEKQFLEITREKEEKQDTNDTSSLC
jgi:hypothetical protein